MPRADSVFAVVPIKPFALAKSRLAGAVGPIQRAEIAQSLARRVLKAIAGAGVSALVVTSDPDARIIAAETGAEIVEERGGGGLNSALALGIETAEARGAGAVLLIHADLPHVTSADIRSALIRPGVSGVTLAPAADDGGTNALCLPLPTPVHPAYGEDSFNRHMNAAISAGCSVRVLRRTGLAVDVDRPGDLGA